MYSETFGTPVGAIFGGRTLSAIGRVNMARLVIEQRYPGDNGDTGRDHGPDRMTAHESAAYNLGAEHARAAASWIDPLSESAASALLEDLLSGDPAVYDYLPAMPNLSGEYADEMTPVRLWGEIVGYSADGGIDDPNDGDDLASLCDAYEQGVADTFEPECERILRSALED